ncbi:MAG TPA: hypothetical protein VIA62_20570 [Thermoanaerobaculia bacterium]|nr:hypothetical protein [Thermoanaerobaculia bacterium]
MVRGRGAGPSLPGREFYRGELETLIRLAREGREPVLRRSFSEVDISVGFIPKPLLSLFEVPITIMGLFVPGAVRDFLLRNRVLPARNPSFATPRRGRPGEALRADLTASLDRTRALLQSNADLEYRRMVLQHPLTGRNDVPGMLRFLSLHEQRHQDQIRETLERNRVDR